MGGVKNRRLPNSPAWLPQCQSHSKLMGHSLSAGITSWRLLNNMGDAPGPPSLKNPYAPPSSSLAWPGVSVNQ